jgi:hypothetical protein
MEGSLVTAHHSVVMCFWGRKTHLSYATTPKAKLHNIMIVVVGAQYNA